MKASAFAFSAWAAFGQNLCASRAGKRITLRHPASRHCFPARIAQRFCIAQRCAHAEEAKGLAPLRSSRSSWFAFSLLPLPALPSYCLNHSFPHVDVDLDLDLDVDWGHAARRELSRACCLPGCRLFLAACSCHCLYRCAAPFGRPTLPFSPFHQDALENVSSTRTSRSRSKSRSKSRSTWWRHRKCPHRPRRFAVACPIVIMLQPSYFFAIFSRQPGVGYESTYRGSRGNKKTEK